MFSLIFHLIGFLSNAHPITAKCLAVNFKIGCKVSPACICGAESETTIKHYLLMCPLFASQRLEMLSCAAILFAERLLTMSDSAKISAFIYRFYLTDDQNKALFSHVQNFIKESKRFLTISAMRPSAFFLFLFLITFNIHLVILLFLFDFLYP